MIKASFQLRTIGTLLKERRKERDLTLSQISEITRIRKEYLKAIENGEYDTFPSEVYLKGFLKNYSKYLGVNTERALAMYRREREYKNSEPTISTTKKIKDKSVALVVTPGKVIGVVLVGAVLFSIIYIGSYISRIFKEPELTLSNPVSVAAGTEGAVKTEEREILIEGEVEIGTRLTINGQEFQTNNFEKFTEEFELQPGQNTFLLVAESQFGRKTEITLNVFREPSGDTQEQVAGEEAVVETEVTPTPVFIEGALIVKGREAYLEITIDGELLESRVFSIDERYTFEQVTVLEITTPRPDAITINVNGSRQVLQQTDTKWQIQNGEIVKK